MYIIVFDKNVRCNNCDCTLYSAIDIKNCRLYLPCFMSEHNVLLDKTVAATKKSSTYYVNLDFVPYL